MLGCSKHRLAGQQQRCKYSTYLRPPCAVEGCSCQEGGWELDGAGVPQRLCQQRACQANAAVHHVSEWIHCQPRGIQLQQPRKAFQMGARTCTLQACAEAPAAQSACQTCAMHLARP